MADTKNICIYASVPFELDAQIYAACDCLQEQESLHGTHPVYIWSDKFQCYHNVGRGKEHKD